MIGYIIPWTGALLGPTQAYITLVHAANAPPEFVLFGLMVTAAAAMGPITTEGATYV